VTFVVFAVEREATMKFRHAFVFIPCLIVSLSSAVTPGRAVTHITSADTLTVGLGALPADTYTLANIQLNFTNFAGTSGPDVLNVGEGFHVSLFTSGNSLVSEQTHVAIVDGISTSVTLLGPVDNTGHFFIDQIVGSFDLYSIFVSGFVGDFASGHFTEAFTTSFSVGAATPLPAALPLFAGGLGTLGLLGWRRKKKATLAA